MKDLGPLYYFHKIQVTPTLDGLILSQSKYAIDILDHAQSQEVKHEHPNDAKNKGSH